MLGAKKHRKEPFFKFRFKFLNVPDFQTMLKFTQLHELVVKPFLNCIICFVYLNFYPIIHLPSGPTAGYAGVICKTARHYLWHANNFQNIEA